MGGFLYGWGEYGKGVRDGGSCLVRGLEWDKRGPIWHLTDQWYHGSGHMGEPLEQIDSDMIENITILQLHCWVVIIYLHVTIFHKMCSL